MTMNSGVKASLNLLFAGILLGYLAGCNNRAAKESFSPDIPESFSTGGEVSVQDKWWQEFKDADLNGLVDEALSENLNLLVAWDRLAQAQASANKVDSLLWPSADLTAGAGRSRQEISSKTTYTSDYSIGLAARYEVDFWSRIKSSQLAAHMNTEARREAVHTVAISISASVAETWYQLAEAKALDSVTSQQIETNEKVLKIVTTQFRNGLASAADVLRQRQLVESTKALKIAVEEATLLLQNRLSILIGDVPNTTWQDTTIDFPTLTALPDLGLPIHVLRRRPDVRGAYNNVQAADHRLAAAIADQYPRLSISARVETFSPSVHDLFDDWMANLIGNAVQPLFDAGARKAEVKRHEAIVSETVHLWQQSILNALSEVEDALVQEQQQFRLLENLESQLLLARQTAERNRQRYIKGQIDYIRVLESLQSLQSLERSVIIARRSVIHRRIALYRSIAGKWELPEPHILNNLEINQMLSEANSISNESQERL